MEKKRDKNHNKSFCIGLELKNHQGRGTQDKGKFQRPSVSGLKRRRLTKCQGKGLQAPWLYLVLQGPQEDPLRLLYRFKRVPKTVRGLK